MYTGYSGQDHEQDSGPVFPELTLKEPLAFYKQQTSETNEEKVQRGNKCITLKKNKTKRETGRKGLTEVKPISFKLAWTRFCSNAKLVVLEENCRSHEYIRSFKKRR